MVDNKDLALEGTNILSITDGSGVTHQFASEVEGEVVSLKLKYYMWLARFFIFLAMISLGFFTAASLSLFQLAPQVTVEPFLIIQQNDSSGLVRYEPIEQNMASKNKLMEVFIKQYIILRNTIVNDENEMKVRWFPGGMVNFLSAPEVYYAFEGASERTFQATLSGKRSREVEIISIGKLGGERSSVWKVDFKTYELSEDSRDAGTRGLLLKQKYWTASITSYFFPQRRFMGLRLLNPLGFTVTKYSQVEVSGDY